MKMFTRFTAVSLSISILLLVSGLETPGATNADPTGLTHAFLATGTETRIVDGSGKTIWKYPGSTRDGWVLSNGHLLLAVSRGNELPGGGVVELTREGKTLFEWKGTQAEVNTVQALPDDKFLVSEAGAKPRLLEIDRNGQVHL